MQVNSISNNNFGRANLLGDFNKIKNIAIKKGLKADVAENIERKLQALGDEATRKLKEKFNVTFKLPQDCSVTGRVFVENAKGNGFDVAVSPVDMGSGILNQYAKAAKMLSELDYSKAKGLNSIA